MWVEVSTRKRKQILLKDAGSLSIPLILRKQRHTRSESLFASLIKVVSQQSRKEMLYSVRPSRLGIILNDLFQRSMSAYV